MTLIWSLAGGTTDVDLRLFQKTECNRSSEQRRYGLSDLLDDFSSKTRRTLERNHQTLEAVRLLSVSRPVLALGGCSGFEAGWTKLTVIVVEG